MIAAPVVRVQTERRQRVMIAAIAARAVLEERRLERDLPGHADYAARVRYRLVPGVW